MPLRNYSTTDVLTLCETVVDFSSATVLVVGDVMLDEYFFGSTTRISPEAPIPVFRVNKRQLRLGGAANTAANVAALGASVSLIGVIGDDEEGRQIEELLYAANVGTERILKVGTPFRTTKKRRYLTDDAHVFRSDFESDLASFQHAALLAEHLKIGSHNASVILLSDYGKGVITSEFLRLSSAFLTNKNTIVLIDPHEKNIADYPGSCIIKLNGFELVPGSRRDAVTANEFEETNLQKRLSDLKDRTSATAAIVTLGSEGACFLSGCEFGKVPAAKTAALDVTGAGDTFFACLGLSLGAGMDLKSAIALANVSSALSVSKRATATTSVKELISAIVGSHSPSDQVLDLITAARLCNAWQLAGQTVGFTNGCFDLLHSGHLRLFEYARSHCDRLIVGLNSDNSVAKLKGHRRPIIPLEDRAKLLAALDAVNLVVPFEQDTPIELIRALRPDVLVKGEDYEIEEIVGAAEVMGRGGKVLRAPLVPQKSTTAIVLRTQEPSD